MYKLCKTEKSAVRQREIENGLLSMLKNKRYDEITVSELCEKMDMPRKAFYRYFDSKDDCLRALIDHKLMGYWELEAREGKRGERDLLSELENFFLFWKREKDLLDALSKSDMLGMLIEISASSVSETVNSSKFLPAEADWMRRTIFQFSICGLMFSMIGWYRSGFNRSTSKMADAAVRMLSKPLFPDLDKIGFI